MANILSNNRFSVSSDLKTDRKTVWEQCSRLDGVNREFFPFLKMTSPCQAKGLSLEDAPLGQPLFRSWILLFGLIPVDFDHITLTQMEPGVYFQEKSVMASQKTWKHRRELEDLEGGCRLTDTLCFEPRLPAPLSWQRALFVKVFEYRHLRLKKIFGVL